LVYIHGGGWISGQAPMYVRALTNVQEALDYVIVYVEYRLAPETRFPGALADVFHAVHWISEHIARYGGDNLRIALAGESAGGNLAIAFSM
ncbi:lipase, partial [Tribonema minus]